MLIEENNELLISSLKQRREKLAHLFDQPVILWSGESPARNFPANRYPFRANSHFLYFAGLPLENAVIRLENGKLQLFIDESPPSSALWHGETPSRATIAQAIAADAAYPLEELATLTTEGATIPLYYSNTYEKQLQILQRPLESDNKLTDIDLDLAKAIIQLRLIHDTAALAELRKAAAVSVAAHQAGMAAARKAKTEAEVRGAMEAVIIAANMKTSYNSIVTVQGEVLHNESYHNHLQLGDLLLADVGAETRLGWAADITRTYPVSGKFSPTQRDIYDIVLAAHDNCIDQMRPGVEYQDIHFLAALTITQGLIDLGIFQGKAADLVEIDAHALFFPHGIGHLLGLDVHDMEDLGDLAGYETDRKRSTRFGYCYLRLHRPLSQGMLVTIEPGFYQVPAILNNPEFRAKYQDIVNWERLQKFSDVRGIRIEDDVLITSSGTEVLTAALPNQAEKVELLLID